MELIALKLVFGMYKTQTVQNHPRNSSDHHQPMGLPQLSSGRGSVNIIKSLYLFRSSAWKLVVYLYCLSENTIGRTSLWASHT